MDHDHLALHEELLRVIDEQTDLDAFAHSIATLANQYGPETYSELVLILANLKTSPMEAMTLWNATWEHMGELSRGLKRPVNITVALLDYLLVNREGEYIHRAKVIDILDYEKVAQSAIRDGLTGVFNTGYIREQVKWELTKDRRFKHGGTIILFDLNRFKQCNDEYGHLAGDAVLKSFAEVIKLHTRRADVVGRYGGDEFLTLMPSTLLEGAFIVADRIRRSFEDTVTRIPSGPPEGIRVTATGGIAEYRGNIDQAESLILAADQALYLAKRQGGNRIYTEHMVGTESIRIERQRIRSTSQTDLSDTESLNTIGNRTFTIVSSERMVPGQGLICELSLADGPEFFRCTGIVQTVLPRDNNAWDISFYPVHRNELDWIPVNRLVTQHEREEKNKE